MFEFVVGEYADTGKMMKQSIYTRISDADITLMSNTHLQHKREF